MLRFFFDRFGWFVRFLEMVGVVEAILLFQLFHWEEGLQWTEYLYFLLVAQVLFVKLCDMIPWYPSDGGHRARTGSPPIKARDWLRQTERIGIEVHFRKARVPTSYIFATASALYLLGLSGMAIIIANLMIAVITTVNGIQLWFHYHDKEELPINYFTKNQHLEKGVAINEEPRFQSLES